MKVDQLLVAYFLNKCFLVFSEVTAQALGALSPIFEGRVGLALVAEAGC